MLLAGKSTSQTGTPANCGIRYKRVSNPPPRMITASSPSARASMSCSSMYRLRHSTPAHPPQIFFSVAAIIARRTGARRVARAFRCNAGGSRRIAYGSMISGELSYCSVARTEAEP
ncbi:Uncharacterised protein [Mycobacteroides abscessus subsp. abscessus]|nr:Uncharacterised protein [Mycobacteroides abscessus subsp. abscessus]